MKSKIIVFICLVPNVFFCQDKLIKGKVTADGNFVGGINLVNIVNEKSAITDDTGAFEILAKEDDMLVFSALNFHYKRRIIMADDIKSGEITVVLEIKPVQLEEVVINQFQHLTAFNLGIINFQPIQYTVGERRMISGVGSRSEQKARIEIEKKSRIIDRVENLFKEEYFTETLKIDPLYVMAFKYYFSEDEKFQKLVEKNNKNDITLALIELAAKYNALQIEEVSKE